MTVDELIFQLKKYDRDIKVVIVCGEYCMDIVRVEGGEVQPSNKENGWTDYTEVIDIGIKEGNEQDVIVLSCK